MSETYEVYKNMFFKQMNRCSFFLVITERQIKLHRDTTSHLSNCRIFKNFIRHSVGDAMEK